MLDQAWVSRQDCDAHVCASTLEEQFGEGPHMDMMVRCVQTFAHVVYSSRF